MKGELGRFLFAERDGGVERLEHGGSGQRGVGEIRRLVADQSDRRWLAVRQRDLRQRKRARVERAGEKIGRPSTIDPQLGESAGARKRGPGRAAETCRGRGNGTKGSSEAVQRIDRTHSRQCRGESCQEDEWQPGSSFRRVSTVFSFFFLFFLSFFFLSIRVDNRLEMFRVR